MVIDRNFFRPAEVYELRGNFAKAKKELAWEPEVKFKDLVKMMVELDLKTVRERIQSQKISE